MRSSGKFSDLSVLCLYKLFDSYHVCQTNQICVTLFLIHTDIALHIAAVQFTRSLQSQQCLEHS